MFKLTGLKGLPHTHPTLSINVIILILKVLLLMVLFATTRRTDTCHRVKRRHNSNCIFTAEKYCSERSEGVCISEALLKQKGGMY